MTYKIPKVLTVLPFHQLVFFFFCPFFFFYLRFIFFIGRYKEVFVCHREGIQFLLKKKKIEPCVELGEHWPIHSQHWNLLIGSNTGWTVLGDFSKWKPQKWDQHWLEYFSGRHLRVCCQYKRSNISFLNVFFCLFFLSRCSLFSPWKSLPATFGRAACHYGSFLHSTLLGFQ